MPPYVIDSVYVFSFILFIQRVLSVVWSGGKLGSAYYDTETSQLYLQMDVIEVGINLTAESQSDCTDSQ